MFRRPLLSVISLTLLCIIAAGAYAQDSIKLEYKFTTGEVLRYKTVIQAVVTPNFSNENGVQVPPVSFQSVGIIKYRTTRVLENGDAEMNVALESMKIDVAGQTKNIEGKDCKPIRVIMSKNGVVKFLDSPNLTPIKDSTKWFDQMKNMQVPAFPSGAVTIGDTWTQSIPLPMNMGSLQTCTQLVNTGVRKGNYTVAVLQQDVTGNLAYSGSVPGAEKQTGTTVLGVNGSINSRGTTLFSTDRGCAVSSDWTMTASGSFSISDTVKDQGSFGPVNVDIEVNGQMFLLPQ